MNGRALMEIDCEICVLGGGPAGSVIARRLAQLGYDTALVDRDRQVKEPRAESLAPSIFPMVDSLGLRDQVAAATFCRERHALLLWVGQAVEVKRFDAEPSLLLERTQLDQLLRAAAASAGARLLTPAAARSPSRLASGVWLVPVDTPKGLISVRARFLVDGRGRARQGDNPQRGLCTTAISAVWDIGDLRLGETRIEAASDCWFWGSPFPGRRYAATIFVDPARLSGLGSANRERLYRALLARGQLFDDLLNGKIVSPTRVRDVTSSISRELIGPDFIRVGETAVAIDPLASQGIQGAIVSALQGAAAVHTILSGHDPAPALEFYQQRQLQAAAKARRHAAHFYALRAATEPTTFWKSRSLLERERPFETRSWSRRPNGLPDRLRPSSELRMIEVPVLAGVLIKRAPALSHPALEQPVAYFRGIELGPLIVEASTVSSTEHLVDRWSLQMAPSTAREIATWMYAVGILTL
jgi:flavin-dependent dehydrogenase